MIIRPILRFVVFSNIWIALGAAGLTLLYYIIFDFRPNLFVLSFVFFSTQLTYTFQRYVKFIKRDRISGERLEWMENFHLYVKIFMVGDLIFCLVLAFFLNLQALIFLLIPAGISFFYAWKLPFGIKFNLRDVPGVKIYLIAIVWAMTCTFFPLFNEGEEIDASIVLLLIAEFIYILAITIPFDIRDLMLDEPEKKTIPQLIGTSFAKMISIILLTVSMVLIAYLSDGLNIGLFLAYIVGFYLVILSSHERKDIFFSFYIDGLLILMPGLIWLFEWINIS